MAFDLETAANPRNLRRIAIDPISRVEGHGKITLLLDDDGRVHQARLHIVEFRGFEKFIQGRPYWEAPVMVQRLCGICPVSHQIAAAKALDHVVGAPPPSAEKMRRLMHYGQILQSHALHFFFLSSPDLLFGFDAEVDQRNIVAVAAQYPEVARQGIALRKWGQEAIRLTSGKRVHGTGAIPGGINKLLSAAERDELRADADQMVAWSRDAVELVKKLVDANRAQFEQFGLFRSSMMSLVRADGALELYDGGLRARGADGALIFDGVSDQKYDTLIREEVKPWTYMKFPYFTQFGRDDGWYKVGPLARVQNCDFISTPLAEVERRAFIEASGGKICHAPLAYHWTRMIEMLHAAELIRDLLGDPDLLAGERVGSGARGHGGVGVIEAPRGTLIHQYEVGDDDLITMCNLIVSTTHNNQAMNEAVRSVARQYIDGQRVTEALLNRIEIVIRAFDPCLSCATHALGKMPLIVELLDAGGDQRRPSRAKRMTRPARWLVFGVGNPSRGDDALGPLFVERLDAWSATAGDLSVALATLTDFQWQIEHALDLADIDVVIFVDASVRAEPPFELAPLAAKFDATHSTHALSPACLLAVAERLGQTVPEAWLLAIPGRAFELGAPPSPDSLSCLDAAFEHLRSRLIAGRVEPRGPTAKAGDAITSAGGQN